MVKPTTRPRHPEHSMPTLSDIYDADQATRDPVVAKLRGEVRIPHPLNGVQYGDGLIPCTHARRHEPGRCS